MNVKRLRCFANRINKLNKQIKYEFNKNLFSCYNTDTENTFLSCILFNVYRIENFLESIGYVSKTNKRLTSNTYVLNNKLTKIEKFLKKSLSSGDSVESSDGNSIE